MMKPILHIKLKFCFLLNIMFLLCYNLSAQYNFFKVYGNNNTDYLGDIAQIDNNSLVATGYVSNAASEGMFCTKLDLNGNIIWDKVFGTNHSHGYTVFPMNKKIFIGGANNNNGGNAEIYCIDTDGNLEWAKEFDFGGNENIVSISNIENDLVLIGNTNSFSGVTMWDILFIKIDQLGNVLSTKKIGTSISDNPYRVIKCKNNSGFIIVGSTTTQVNPSDAFITKINNDGEALWSYLYGGNEAEFLSDGVELPNGNFIFTGTSYSFGNVSNDGDIWVLSTDSLGNTLFSRNYGKFGTDRGKRIIQADSNSLFVTGETWSYGNNKNNAFILGMDKNGIATNFETIGGDLFDYGEFITYHNNSIIIGGYTTSFGFGSTDFFLSNMTLGTSTCYTDTFAVLNNATQPNKTSSSFSDTSISLIQENTITQVASGNVQMEEICNTSSIDDIHYNDLELLIYPNPVTDFITLTSLDENNPITEIHCHDIVGKEVNFIKTSSTDIKLDFRNLPQGVYLIHITMKNKSMTTKKIIKR